MKKQVFILIALFSLTLLTSCNLFRKNAVASTAQSSIKLEGTAWELMLIPGFDREETRKPASIIFEDQDHKAFGFSGCNNYNTSFEQKGTSLHFGQIMSTKMACSPGMDTENRFMGVLKKTDSYKIEEGHLILMEGNTVLAHFTPMSSRK